MNLVAPPPPPPPSPSVRSAVRSPLAQAFAYGIHAVYVSESNDGGRERKGGVRGGSEGMFKAPAVAAVAHLCRL